MIMEIECRTQAEVDVCVKAGNRAVVSSGCFEVNLSAQVTAYGSSQVRAYGSSQVTAYDSSQVTAYDSSQVTAYDSSQVRAYGSSQVTAYGSSQVTACDSSQVTACGSSQVRATGNVFVRLFGALKIIASASVVVITHTHERVVDGGQIIWAVVPETPAQWCDLHGVEVVNGVARLVKAVNDDFTSSRGTNYSPGLTPIAADWDAGKAECGGGLHFSPSAAQALAFHGDAKRFVTCFVAITDMRAPQPGDKYPEKIKARGCCAPCVECDINGNLVPA